MRYKLAIFDMDGTILDTLEDIRDATNHVLKEAGFPERSTEEVRAVVGNGALQLITESAPAGTPAPVCKELLATFQTYYRAHSNDKTRAYEGVPELLRDLKDAGVTLAVVSNKPDAAVPPLCDLYFKGLFDLAIGERDDIKRKPAPDMVEYALRTLGFEKKDAVYIGDSEVDVQTAGNAGLDLIAVNWGFRTVEELKKAGAETIVSAPGEVFRLIHS
ncbi:MAG: HAD family hydrolase [Lachnospiraceae bacterium]|nr:HAD family hydrolase [Lachnospiraceae bacterium]